MAQYRTNKNFPVILTVIVIIVAIAGFVALARLLFTGSSSTSIAENQARENLLSTADGRAVSMTVRGRIIADEDFRSYRITVTPSSRKFQVFRGYLDVLLDQQTLSNNTAAYAEFVNALNKANMVKGIPFEDEANSTLGICATGRVFEFYTINDGDVEDIWWTSTCSGSPGSLKASSVQLSQLFLNQIPSGSDITDSLKL